MTRLITHKRYSAMNEDLYRTDLPRDVQNILCIIPQGISNAITSTPALEATRQAYPEAAITLITDQHTAPLFTHWPYIKKVIVLEKTSAWASIQTLIRLYMEQFDLLIDFYTPHLHIQPNSLPESQEHNGHSTEDPHDLRRHLLFRTLTRSKTSIGFTVDPASYHHALLGWLGQKYRFSINTPTPKVESLEQDNLADLTLGLVIDQKKIGIAAPLYAQQLYLHYSKEACTLIDKISYTESKVTKVGLYFGGTHQTQQWPIQNTVEFIQLILKKLKVQLHIFGGKSELQYSKTLVERFAPEISDTLVVNHIDQLNVIETTAFISRCSIMVSTIGGPLTIADALNIPLITLATSSIHFHNRSARQAKQIVLNTPVSCNACYKNTCDQAVSCQAKITAQQALEAVHNMISDTFSQAHH